MSLHHAAQHLKAQGRGPDDQLIHMSSKEIAGLQALAQAHGTSLTTNPKTGLPEAGILDSVLPTVVGAGIGYFTGDPMLAAEIMGGGTFLKTGNLGQSLMAGLGGYGAGSIGGSLAGLGENALYGAASGMTDEAAQKLGFGSAEEYAQSQVANAGPLSKLQAGIGSVNSAADLGGWGKIGMAGAGVAPALLKSLSPEQKAAAPGTEQMIRPYTYAPNAQNLAAANTAPAPGQQQMVGAQYAPGQDTSERTWFKPEYTALTPYKAAEGGLMSFAAGGDVMQGGDAEQDPNMQQVPAYDPVVRMAQGGISALGAYSDGGRMLKGPGDGMSDNIPAVIGGKQPARLADGEFVVPADVVSHLGNGSTDAGAKQLYKMMDRIRQQRTGKKKQAPEVNPSKAMPA